MKLLTINSALLAYVFLCISCCAASTSTDPCDALKDIRVIPFKGESVDDKAYNSVISSGKSAIPCLIKAITDNTKIRDPRQSPRYEGFAVGDLAVILLCEICGRDFEEQLPKDVRHNFEKEGVAAYFRFVSARANRKKLQDDWQQWLRENQPGVKEHK